MNMKYLKLKYIIILGQIMIIKLNVSDARPPNVILFLADDLGYGDLSYSGHPTSYTPNIDYLATGGRYFSKFYTTSPVCSPSRSSILTGKYFVRSGVYPGTFSPNSYLGLPRDEITMASKLKNLGYSTHMVGKWHLGVGYTGEYLPTNFGFDSYLGIPYSHDMCPCKECFPGNVTCPSVSCWEFDVSCPLFRNENIEEQPTYLPSLTRKLLIDAQKFIALSDKNEEPFFLYFAFHHIHHPQFASSKFFKRSARGLIGDALLEMDWAVGEIMQILHHLKILDNTLIWFTSDNGPSLTHHEKGGSAGLLRCGKGTTMEGGIRVPGIAYWHGKIKPGRTSGLMSAMDILPTTLSLIGRNFSNSVLDEVDQSHLLEDCSIDGVDQSTYVLDPHETSQRKFLAVYPILPSKKLGPYAVVYEKYKAHFYTQGSDLSDKNNYDSICPGNHTLTKHDPPLLFNLDEDPGERYDISNNIEMKKVLNEIISWRNTHMENTKWRPPRTQKFNKFSQPCCTTPKCKNFPSCCDCPNSFEFN